MALEKMNFTLRTPSLPFVIRDFAVAYGSGSPHTANPASKDPRLAAALADGEWLHWNSAGKLTRVADGTAKTAPPILPLYPVYAEKGRTDVQYLEKVPVVFIGEMEADTTILLTGDKDTFAIGDRLVVVEGAIPGETDFLKYSCLAIADKAAGKYTGKGMVVGFVTAKYDTKAQSIRIWAKAGGLGVFAVGE